MLDLFPEEILIEILRLLPLRHVWTFRAVCRRLRDVIETADILYRCVHVWSSTKEAGRFTNDVSLSMHTLGFFGSGSVPFACCKRLPAAYKWLSLTIAPPWWFACSVALDLSVFRFWTGWFDHVQNSL